MLIIGVAAALRLIALPYSPPGLNQDEATNAWNAWCLLHTGADQAGAPWPIFYTRGLGAPTTTPFIYWMIPFQAVGGLNVWTTRLPSAVLGVLTVGLMFYVASRLFGRPTGWIATGLLAIAPWHVTMTRWGHEASLAPLATVAALAAMLWSGLPIAGGAGRRHPLRALLAGVLIGALCYGYGAIRLFLPVFIIAIGIASLPAWIRLLRDRRGRVATVAFVVGLAATLGPLAYIQVTGGAEMSQRADAYWIAQQGKPMAAALGEIVGRYVAHFGLDFLFQRGDLYLIHHPQGGGVLGWPMLPLMLIGILVAMRNAPRSAAARIALCGVLLYPAGDALLHFWVYTRAGEPIESLHLLRSAPGLPMLMLMAAVGAGALLSGLAAPVRARAERGAVFAGAILLLALVTVDARGLYRAMVERPRDPETQLGFHADLVAALTTLKPKIDAADAVFITASRVNMPYIITLVALQYEPRRWRTDEKQRQPSESGEWEQYTRLGKFRFIYGASAVGELRALQQNTTPEKILFIVRPGELKVGEPIANFPGPNGEATLIAAELTL